MKKTLFLLFITGSICYSTVCNASIVSDDNDSTLAIANGNLALQTTYIQNAINYCNSTGGGTVRLTVGAYYTAPIVLKSNVTLRIDSAATIYGSTNMADWSP